ncbi:unnamed protein product [Symbiodinium sp. CCMP2456]|nr:unnamed protein product [Symbiodinium sp. CCMP2456]
MTAAQAHGAMQVTCGTLTFQPLGVGTNKWGTDPAKFSEPNIRGAFETSLSEGVTLLNTAQLYGTSENCIGQLRGRVTGGEKALVISKFDALGKNTEQLIPSLEESASKCGVDALDGFLIHHPKGSATAMADQLAAAYQRGIVRNVGVSNYDETALREMHALLCPGSSLLLAMLTNSGEGQSLNLLVRRLINLKGSESRSRDELHVAQLVGYPRLKSKDCWYESSGRVYIDMRPVHFALTAAAYQIVSDEFRDLRIHYRLNQLVFQFSLNIRPLATGILALRGPRGFEFDDNCLPYVITDRNDVFGPNTQDVWPPDYSEWPPEYRPTKCAGNGREALITVPSGLGRNSLYVFRIGVRRNPMSTPEWNKWSINFNEQASDPFQGFTVWTFTNMNIMAVGAMKTPTGAGIIRTPTPVTIEFMPFNTVPPKPPNEQFGGMLRLTVPVGYEIQHSNSQCEVELFVTDGSVVFEDSDYSCRVENTVKQLLYMAGAKDIRGGYPYTLITWTFNPPTAAVAETWRIDTFQTWTAEPDTALDETEFLGYNVNNQLNIFQVTNSLNVFNGNTKVNDIDILLNFPDPMKDDDEILIVGPRGFNLIGNPELANCNEFRWVDGVQLPATGEPGCTCDPQGFCTIRWQIDESRDPAYPQNEDIHFKVATTNPSQTPFLTDNYWKASHVKAAVVKSSHIYRGWDINPQLENVDIKLVGNDYAAGKTSDIEVTFTPITDADTIYIEAIFPTQFSFDQSTVALPYDIDGQSEGATLIINRGAFRAGITATIRINTVRLGRAGGQTRFNLITYRDETRTEKRDEKLDFDGGFRLPGLITVQGTPVLKSQYQVAAAANPVKQLFRPRVLEDAQAEFTLSFTRPVQASERLLITCQGQAQYQLKQSPFVVIGIGQIENQVEIDSFGTLRATLKPGRPATEVALQADTPYTIIMWVLPIQGANTWRFDTSDGGSLPTNTNDGDLDGFYPVEQMVLGVEAVRSPPKAVVDVILNIDAGSAIVRELIIIAPPSFLFDESAGGCGNMCLPGEALSSTSRRTATIQSPTGEPLTQLRNLKVRVLTPAQTPSSVTWYVEGRGQGAGTTVGWGEGPGFFVTQMAGTSVMYPAVATIAQAQIVFTFALNINAGNQINIEAPPGFILTCSTEGALKQISLPGGKQGPLQHAGVSLLYLSRNLRTCFHVAFLTVLSAEYFRRATLLVGSALHRANFPRHQSGAGRILQFSLDLSCLPVDCGVLASEAR